MRNGLAGTRSLFELVLELSTVRPYGTYGAAGLTAHPAGLVVVAGVILIAVTGMPAARWQFSGSVTSGAVFGFFLWLSRRRI
jgi:hypothetical protein